MAALGAAAGAFEGDRAREQERMARARLAQQGAMFNAQMRQRQSEAERQQANFDRSVEIGQKDKAYQREWQQGEAGRQQANLDRAFQAGQEKESYERGRSERKDAWREALSAQEMLERESRIKTNRLQFEELDRASKMEREQLANRKQFAKTGLGALALAALKNGGIASQAAVEIFNRQQQEAGTGIKVSGGAWSENGFTFKRRGPGQDQNGNTIETDYDEVLAPAIAYALFKDEFGEEIAREQTASQRENARYANAQKIAETRSGGKVDYFTQAKVNIEEKKALAAYKYIEENALEEGSDEYDRKMKEVASALENIDRLKGGGSTPPSSQEPPVSKGNAGGAAYDPEVVKESARLKKIAMTLPERERNAYYTREMKKFTSRLAGSK